mmetsp:Transcript_20443/g.52446  ORF Transcript_20443/g.52446 Transcript_20443/m.52446 type:complete len:243 (+) Transcript_20443:1664-2392(+)
MSALRTHAYQHHCGRHIICTRMTGNNASAERIWACEDLICSRVERRVTAHIEKGGGVVFLHTHGKKACAFHLHYTLFSPALFVDKRLCHISIPFLHNEDDMKLFHCPSQPIKEGVPKILPPILHPLTSLFPSPSWGRSSSCSSLVHQYYAGMQSLHIRHERSLSCPRQVFDPLYLRFQFRYIRFVLLFCRFYLFLRFFHFARLVLFRFQFGLRLGEFRLLLKKHLVESCDDTEKHAAKALSS